MSTPITHYLYTTYYANPSQDHAQASAHWKNFSKRFRVETDEEGQIKTIQGYGFGGSGDKRFVAKITARIGNRLILSKLNYPGLLETITKARQTVAEMGLSFSQDALRQACTAFFLEKQASETQTVLNNILIIGDGHGILSALLSEKFPQARVWLIDLGATLFFQSYYLGKKFPAKPHLLSEQVKAESAAGGFAYCAAEEPGKFPDVNIDLAINIASMQEMTMDVITGYFNLLRRNNTKLFYCCNRLEKVLPDGQVIRFDDYPWKKGDVYLVDEKCSWHQFFFGRSSSEHVKLMNILPVPMLHKYDGVHWHRLTLLSK